MTDSKSTADTKTATATDITLEDVVKVISKDHGQALLVAATERMNAEPPPGTLSTAASATTQSLSVDQQNAGPPANQHAPVNKKAPEKPAHIGNPAST